MPAGPGYTVIWRYGVQPDMVEEFERRCGPSGEWTQLFARAPGYLERPS